MESDEDNYFEIAAAIILPPFIIAVDVVPLQNDAAAAMVRTLSPAATKHGNGVNTGLKTLRMGVSFSSSW